jgi:hypothetical protein
MSANWDSDDLARLLAIEHAFYAMALIGACNFAHGAKTTPVEAIKHFRSAIEGSIYDSADTSEEVRKLMRTHLKRMFDHVETMSKNV